MTGGHWEAARRACVRAALTLASPPGPDGRWKAPEPLFRFSPRSFGSQVRGDFCRSWQRKPPNRAQSTGEQRRAHPPADDSPPHARKTIQKKKKRNTPRERAKQPSGVCVSAGEPGVAGAGLPGGEEHDQRRRRRSHRGDVDEICGQREQGSPGKAGRAAPKCPVSSRAEAGGLGDAGAGAQGSCWPGSVVRTDGRTDGATLSLPGCPRLSPSRSVSPSVSPLNY